MGKNLEGSGRSLPEVLFRRLSGEIDVECENLSLVGYVGFSFGFH